MAPYADGTVVTRTAAPVGADAGDVLTFTGNGPDTVVATTSLPAAGHGDGRDSLVPAAWWDELRPVERDGQRFSVRSPHGRPRTSRSPTAPAP